MQDLAKLKQTLRELVVVDDGMESAFLELEKELPTNVPKYNTLLQLRARLNEIDSQRVKKILYEESITTKYNSLRDDVLLFFNALQESDFSLEAAKKANLGGVLYRIPERMQHLKKSKCIVRVAYDESVLKDTLDTEVDVVIEALRVSKNMEVKLVDEEGDGEYFEITSRSTPEQFLEQDEYTEWTFFVKPLEVGSYPLALIISLIIIDENGKDRKKDIVLERTIRVISEPVPEEAGDHTMRKAGILFALTDSPQKPGGGKPPKKKPWLSAIVALALLGALGWWLYNKFFPKSPDINAFELKGEGDFKEASKQNSPELLIAFLAKNGGSKFAPHARELVTKLLPPNANVDSLIADFKKKNDIPLTNTSDEKPPAGQSDSIDIEPTNPGEGNQTGGGPTTASDPTKNPPDGTAAGGPGTSGNPTTPGVDKASPATNPGGPTASNSNSTTTPPAGNSTWKDKDLATSDPMKWLPSTMVKVKGGSYKMGCNVVKEGQCTGRALPQHDVKVADFYISRFEVTQALWEAVMGKRKNNSGFKGCDLCPVENVSWNQVQEFIEKLNKLQPGCNYRLPSEAEWEFAARQRGQEVRFGDGTGRATPANINFSSRNLPGRSTEQAGIDREATVPIFDLRSNSLGLFHMSGNVFEWVMDRWHDDYLGAPTDASAWVDGNDNRRVIKGGSWNMEPFQNYNRDAKPPNKGDDEVGFRLVSEAACGQ
jgi:formylglycine-generating enzyme required for sulfatase activity